LFLTATCWGLKVHLPQEEKPDMVLTAPELYRAFEANRSNAYKTFDVELLEVTGTVCRVIGGEHPAEVWLAGYSCGEKGVIKCNLQDFTTLEQVVLGSQQDITICGHIGKIQSQYGLVLDCCRVLAY